MLSSSALSELPFSTSPDVAIGALASDQPAGPRSARDVAAIYAELSALLPTGWAWSGAPDTLLERLLFGAAGELARIEAAAEAMLPQVDPRLSLELLEDYERVLGPDPCGRDLVDATGSLDDRRRYTHQRWTALGFQTPAYFEAVAAALGVEAHVTEIDVAVLGTLECGMELGAEIDRFAWRVSLPETRVIEAECGALECGGYLGEIVPSLVECVIRRLAPAHTMPFFSYAEAA